MLKWVMRVVPVGGALLAMAVGTAAWRHRTQGRLVGFVTPTIWSGVIISPRHAFLEGWLRRDWEPDKPWYVEKYGVAWDDSDDANAEVVFRDAMDNRVFGKQWRGFGVVRGDIWPPRRPSFVAVLCPTWSLITALLLPMGLWAGIGWRQRRRVKAGHCANCGYDLRATPEKCPECGRAVKRKAE